MKGGPYRALIEAAIQAVRIRSATRYSWFDRESPRLPRRVEQTLDRRSARQLLLNSLQQHLYASFYSPGRALPAIADAGGLPVVGAVSHVDRLSRANSGRGCWDDDWRFQAFVDAGIAARRNGLTLRFRDGSYVLPARPARGARVRIRLPKEFLGMSPGFYVVLSNEHLRERAADRLVRIYWNVTPEGAVSLVERATAVLNHAKLAFSLKTLKDPARYTRCDAAVLYLRKRDMRRAAPLVERIHEAVATGLKPLTPALTKAIAPGVGFAEDPPGPDSFGMHRCGLLADGILRAHDARAVTLADRLAIVERRFARAGLDLERPFLNAGSSDRGHFSISLRSAVRATSVDRSRTLQGRDALDAADRIGRSLTRAAVWHADRCNWMGLVPAVADPTDGPSRWTYSALGPELYSGTSGVAWFLADLAVQTDDPAAGAAARGAIRHALSSVDTIRPPARWGLYSGATGVALAAATVGVRLADEELTAEATQLVARLLDESARTTRVTEFDVLSGQAGAIVALVSLHDLLHDPRPLTLARRMAAGLLRHADTRGGSYSWPSGLGGGRNLTGFSHGAAGIGYALLELFAATGVPAYRRAAMRAFAYERRWFDAEAGNWPDFRGRRRHEGAVFATAWCNGAAGIAMSRLRAYELTGDDTCRVEAESGLQTTRGAISAMLEATDPDFSLCHGLGGNADALIYASQVLGANGRDASLIEEVAIRRGELEGEPGDPGSRRAPLDTVPGLMLGASGVGHFLLRVHDANIPQVLLLRRVGRTAA